jgi:hypothetical protein
MMMPKRSALLVALLVAVVIAPRAAFAQPAAPNPVPTSAIAPAPAADPPLEFEAGRTAAQYMVGVLVAAVPFMGLEDSDTALVLLAATPALVGGATCLIGRGGQHDGACWATVLGAYLGAATLYPLAYLGYLNDDTSSRPGGEQIYGNAILGAALGWFLVQPLGATLGWHFSRSPRRPITAGLPPRTAPRLLQPPRRRDPHVRPAPVAPVLSLRF